MGTGGGWKLMFVTQTNHIRYLPSLCIPRPWVKERFRHIAWTKVGKKSITHTDKLPRHRENAGECKSWCFSCSSFIHYGCTETVEKQIFHTDTFVLQFPKSLHFNNKYSHSVCSRKNFFPTDFSSFWPVNKMLGQVHVHISKEQQI